MRFIIALLLSLFLASCACAAEVGKITYAEGRVDILSSGSDKGVPATDGTAVNVGDAIRTKSNSKAEVRFYDKTVMRIAANSKVDILDYQLDAGNNRVSAGIKLERGKARTIIAKMPDAAEFRIDTPNAKGSVKGSDVVTFFQAGNSGMMVTEGVLSVFSTAHPKDVLSVPAGNAVLIPLEDMPKGPRKVLEVEQKLHEQDTAIPETIGTRKGAAVIRGTIAKFTGDVRVTPKGSSEAHPAKQGEIVNEGDKVATGATGIVEIAFDNGNALYLKGDTKITIIKLIVDSKTGEFENLIEADKGDVKARVEGLKGKSKFEIKTPTAICGARGTIILVHIALNGATSSFFEGGNGYTTNLQSGETLESTAGSGATTGSGGGVTGTTGPTGDDRTDMDSGFDPEGGTGDSSGGTGGEGLGDTAGGGGGGVSDFSDTANNANNDSVDTDVVDVPITVADSGILDQAEEVEHITQVGDFFYAALDALGEPYLVDDGGGMYDFTAAGPNPGDPDDFALVWAATSSSSGVAVTFSGNYDTTDSAGQYHIWTTDDLYGTTSDIGKLDPGPKYNGGAFYCVTGGTIDTGLNGFIKSLVIGLYVDSDGDAGVLFGQAYGDNTEAFALDQGSSFWVDRVYATGSHSGVAFGITPANLPTSIKNDGQISGKGYSDLGSGAGVALNLVDGFSASFDLEPVLPDRRWGMWAARFAGSQTDVSGPWNMQMAGISEEYGYQDGAWMQRVVMNAWGVNELSGTCEGFALGLSDTGGITVSALTNGRALGNYIDVAAPGVAEPWQAVACGEWIEVYDGLVVQDMGVISAEVQNVYNNGYISVPITEVIIPMSGSGSFVSGGSLTNVAMDMRIYEMVTGAANGAWAAKITADFSGCGAAGWSALVENLITDPKSSVTLTGTQWDGSAWQANVSGTVVDADLVSRTVSGIAAGTITTTGTDSGGVPYGTIEGSGVGTWNRPDGGEVISGGAQIQN